MWVTRGGERARGVRLFFLVTGSQTRPSPATTGIYLYWMPHGAGGAAIVRFNGRMYEAIKARRERRRPPDFCHTALEVTIPTEGRAHRTL